MKRFHLVNLIIKVISCIFPYKLSILLRKVNNRFLSARLSSVIDLGDNCLFHNPVHVKGGKYIRIGNRFSAGPSFRIECWDEYYGKKYNPEVIIGDDVCFNYNCHVGAIEKIYIGNNVLIGSHVLITDHSHGGTSFNSLNISPALRELHSKGPVVIEDDVWIGEGVCILPNVKVGHNSVIGANAVVNKSIPPFSVVVGNPAKVIKTIDTTRFIF